MLRELVYLVLSILGCFLIFGLGYLAHQVTVGKPNLSHIEVLFQVASMGIFSVSIIGITILCPIIVYDKVVEDCRDNKKHQSYSEL